MILIAVLVASAGHAVDNGYQQGIAELNSAAALPTVAGPPVGSPEMTQDTVDPSTLYVADVQASLGRRYGDDEYLSFASEYCQIRGLSASGTTKAEFESDLVDDVNNNLNPPWAGRYDLTVGEADVIVTAADKDGLCNS